MTPEEAKSYEELLHIDRATRRDLVEIVASLIDEAVEETSTLVSSPYDERLACWTASHWYGTRQHDLKAVLLILVRMSDRERAEQYTGCGEDALVCEFLDLCTGEDQYWSEI